MKQNQHTASPASLARKPIRIHSQPTDPDTGHAAERPAQHQMPGGSWWGQLLGALLLQTHTLLALPAGAVLLTRREALGTQSLWQLTQF